MKKVIFLVCLLLVSSCHSQGINGNQTDDKEIISSGINNTLSINEHNPDLGNSCTCPYCLGLLDSKDDISLRSL